MDKSRGWGWVSGGYTGWGYQDGGAHWSVGGMGTGKGGVEVCINQGGGGIWKGVYRMGMGGEYTGWGEAVFFPVLAGYASRVPAGLKI